MTPGTPPFVSLCYDCTHGPYNEPGPGMLGVSQSSFRPMGPSRDDMELRGITLDRLGDRRRLLSSFDDFRREADASGSMEGLDVFTEQAMGILTSSRLGDALDYYRQSGELRSRIDDQSGIAVALSNSANVLRMQGKNDEAIRTSRAALEMMGQFVRRRRSWMARRLCAPVYETLIYEAEANHHFLMMTVRSEGQFNTVVYEEHDIYRGQDRRDVVMMHPDDIERFGFEVNQRVTVRSETGALANLLVRSIDIRPGNAVMYYPEANAIIPKRADPRSRTPAFKNTVVRIEPSPANRTAQ